MIHVLFKLITNILGSIQALKTREGVGRALTANRAQTTHDASFGPLVRDFFLFLLLVRFFFLSLLYHHVR
jgi:hypothetical protein